MLCVLVWETDRGAKTIAGDREDVASFYWFIKHYNLTAKITVKKALNDQVLDPSTQFSTPLISSNRNNS